MKLVLRDVQITVDGVDMSDHCTEVTVEDSAAEVDSTAFGSKYTQALKGMRTAQITATFQQDFATGSIDAKLNALNNTDTPFLVKVIPGSGSASPTNPAYQIAAAQLHGYQPISGGVGALSTTSVTFTNAGNAGVERLTS